MTAFRIKMESTDQFLSAVEAALHSLVSMISGPQATVANNGIDLYSDLYNGAILTIENIIFAKIDRAAAAAISRFPGITEVIQSIRTLVVELNAVEDEAQR